MKFGRRLRGLYKVKSADLRPLFERARKMSQGFASFRIEHVRRERNREADALANEALDEISGGSERVRFFNGELLSASDLTGEQTFEKGKKSKARSIRAVYRAGALHPVQPLDIPDGAEIEIEITSRRKRS